MKTFKLFMINLLCITGIALSFRAYAQGQAVCGTDEMYAARQQANPQIASIRQKMDAYVDGLRNAQAKDNVDQGQEIIVPICFHVIYNGSTENISDAVIEQEVERLNIDYNLQNADTSTVRAIFKPLISNPKITFKLATMNPWGQCTSGIDRVQSPLTDNASDAVKALDWWDSRYYLNVWVVHDINSAGLPPGEQIAGYSHFPWDAAVDPADDGIVIGYSYIGKNQRVLTHEIGHYFGLYHPFQDGCSNDQNMQGDHIADTPPVSAANQGWNPGVNSCHTDNPDLPDLIEDYMDYASRPCMFTKDQVWRLRAFALGRGTLIADSNIRYVLQACTAGISGSFNPSVSVELFPNPANDMVTLQISSAAGAAANISVEDITGKTLFVQRDIHISQAAESMNLSRQQMKISAAGVYFMKIATGNTVTEKKIIFRN